MTPLTLLKLLINSPHQTPTQASKTYEATGKSWCIRDKDSFTWQFTLLEPMAARDGTPVVIKVAYADGRVLSVQGFIADRDGNSVEVLTFQAINFEGSRVTLEVDGKSVDDAVDGKLQKMQEAGGIPNPDLLSKVLSPPHPMTIAAERKREREIEHEMGLLELFQPSDSTATPSGANDPAKIVKAIKFTDLQPAAIPGLEALTEHPKSNQAPAGADQQMVQTPSPEVDEIESLLVATAHKDVRFVLAATGTPGAAFAVRAAMRYREEGQSVLVVGSTNKSIDKAWAAAVRTRDGDVPPALRVGSRYREVPYWQPLSWEEACAKRPHLLAALEKLTTEIADLSKQGVSESASPETVDQVKKLIQQRDGILNDLTAEALKEVTAAPLVFANLSSALLCPALMARNFDVVIFFDAHLASVREVVALVGLATEAVIIIGDCRTYKAPGAERGSHDDIFEYCGVTKIINAGAYDPRFVPLRRPQKIHPDITQVISRVAYGGLLIPSNGSRGQESSDDWESLGVVVMDTNHFSPEAFEFGDQDSRFSPLSAVLSLKAACCRSAESSEDSRKSVLVTSYPLQNQLHNALIRDSGLQHIVASTMDHPLAEPVGSVFLDVTDASGAYSPGWKLRGGVSSPTLRWLTQVMTSGKEKVRIVANMPLLLATLPPDAALRLFLKEAELLRKPGISSPFIWFWPPSNLASPGCWCILGEDSAWETIQRDAAKARTRTIYYLPGETAKLLGNKLMDRLLIRGDGIEQSVFANVDIKTLRTLTRKGARVVAPPISKEGSYCCEDGEVIHYMHRSPVEDEPGREDWRRCDSPCVLIDNDVLWLAGSRWQRGRGRPYLRFKGAETVRLLAGYFGLDYLLGFHAPPMTPYTLS